jgi:DNA-binding MarR family transcriptional regulator
MEQLFAQLFEAASVGRRTGEVTAAEAGQTQARWQTLWTIGDGALTVPQISRRLGVSRQNIQHLANELRKEGLVEFGPNPDHKTSPLLALTDEGRRTLTRINAAAETAHRAILEQFPLDDVTALRVLLGRFLGALRSGP